MVVDLVLVPTQFWRDKLLGKGVVGFKGTASGVGLRDDEEFNFLEGNFKKSIVDGVLSIAFFDRIQQILIKYMTTTMGPWIVYDQYLTIQPWTKEFSPLQPFSNVVLAWIKLLGLHGHMYKRKILGEAGSMVGRVSKLDFNSDSRTMGHFARMVEGKELVADSMITDVEKKETPGTFELFSALTTLDEIEGRNGTESTDQPEGSGMQKGSLVEKNQGNLFGKKGWRVGSIKQGAGQMLGVEKMQNFGLKGPTEEVVVIGLGSN
ncbi:hypothetical protein Gotri_004466 [Gossypium trilobum]|uniref:DUF4283 domain-containing protein n=1 Tax=Gossypium trilobum TaxID=34281 RepID=A0A7J9F6Z4_9ROSI|nr:hypothetical protein [Gossypium trilobum]